MPDQVKASDQPGVVNSSKEVVEERAPDWQELFCGEGGGGAKIHVRIRSISRGGVPFLILPNEPVAASRALALYPAQSLMARLSKRLLAFVLRLGLPLAGSRLEVSVDPSAPFLRYLSKSAAVEGIPKFAVLAGNPRARGRRFVILLFDKQGQPRLVIKAGVLEAAMALIEKEAAFLAVAPQNMPGIPRLRSNFKAGSTQAMAMDYIGGDSPSIDDIAKPESIVSSWIDRSRTVSLSQIPAWQRLNAGGHINPGMARWVEGKELHPALYHGDFAPWNIKVKDGDWNVLDWERGEMTGVPGWDWFHFVLQSAVLVNRESTESLFKKATDLLGSDAFARYGAKAKIAGMERVLMLGYVAYCTEIIKQTEGLEKMKSLWKELSARWLK